MELFSGGPRGCNDQIDPERVVGSEPLVFEAGKYVFRETNKNVPYELGFGCVATLR